MTRRRVVVTGLGATTPLGGDVSSTWEALLAGKSGVRKLEDEWAQEASVTFAARVAVEPSFLEFKKNPGNADIGWPNIIQQGQTVFRWAVYEIAPIALRALEAAGLTPETLEVFIPHQANDRIIESLVKSMKLPESVVVAHDIRTSGNTSSASIPLAMDALLAEKPELHGKNALLVGFGAGLVYAGQVVELPSKPVQNSN